MKNFTATLLMGALITAPQVMAEVYDVEDSVGGRNITAFDRVGQRSIGGYMDTEYYGRQNGTQTFQAHRFVLEASSQVHERVLVSSEIEFEYGAILEGDSNDTDGEIKIEQAWADFELTDDHYFRTGIVLVPFGIVNILHDSDMRDTTARPIYAKYIVPTTWMDTGTGVHGELDIHDYTVNYETYFINGLDGNISSSNGLRSARPSLKADNNERLAFTGRISVDILTNLQGAFNFYTGKYSDNNEEGLTMLGLDGQWKKGPLEVLGEYAQVDIDSINNMNGYYVESRYHFYPEFLKGTFLSEGFAHPTFTLFARFSEVDLDTDVSGTDDKTQTTIGINYRPVETVAYKLEGEINTEDGDRVETTGFIASVAVGF